MGKAILSVGKCTDHPYYMTYAAVNVYSIEELCYCLYENAFLLDSDIVNGQLIDWIGEQCGLEELAKDLKRFVNVANAVCDFVTTILEYTAYYKAEDIYKVHTLLKENETLDPLERKTVCADHMLKNCKYPEAVKEYQRLAGMTEDTERLSKLYHNTGVAYAGMFLFGEAAVYFLKAYETAGRIESYRQYLAAKRMQLSEQDYILFIAERKEAYDTSLLLERQIEEIKEAWQDSAEKKRLEALALEDVTEQMKAQYRAMITG